MHLSTFLKKIPRAALSIIVLLLIEIAMLSAPVAPTAEISVGISVTFAPPALPVYVQPLCPGPGFIWLPGYWAWDPEFGYYWVPGMWVRAPFIGALWTPGYWAWSDGVFIWNEGYWGPEVGFYGGIDYGYGYTGVGYAGGYWRDGAFFYNRTVNNINVTNITTVYSKPVARVRPAGASFNGGRGGIKARPTSAQLAAAGQRRLTLSDPQKEQMRAARADPKQRAKVNLGRPAVAATTKAGVFKGHGVISASRAGAPYKAPPAGKAGRTPKTGAESHKTVTAPGGKKAEAPGKTHEPRTQRHAKPQKRERPEPTSKEIKKGEPKTHERITKPEHKKEAPRRESRERRKPAPVKPAEKKKFKGEPKIHTQAPKAEHKAVASPKEPRTRVPVPHPEPHKPAPGNPAPHGKTKSEKGAR